MQLQSIEKIHPVTADQPYKLIPLFGNVVSSRLQTDIKICIASSTGFQAIKISDILYCEAANSYTIFYLANQQKITVSRTLADYEKLLANTSFCRVHKTFLVNLVHFKEYQRGDGGRLILNNGTAIEVSRRKKDDFLQKIKILFRC